MVFGFNFLHRLLGDVHTPHYLNEDALVGKAADKPSGDKAEDNMLFYEEDTGLWKRYRSALSAWVIVGGNMVIMGEDYQEAASKNIAIDPETKALLIKTSPGGGEGGAATFLQLDDTPGSYAGQALKGLRVKSDQDGLEYVALGGNGGVTTFVQLTDTPGSYAGQGGKVAMVKTGEDGLEFVAGGNGGVTTFIALTDTPGSYSGQGGKYVKVKSSQDGLEFVAAAGNGKAKCFVRLTTDQVISNISPGAKIKLTGVDVDVGDNFSTTDYRFTAPEDDYYGMAAQLFLDGQPYPEIWKPYLMINGNYDDDNVMKGIGHTIHTVPGDDSTPRVFWPIKWLNKDDYVEFWAMHHSPGNATVQGTEPYAGHKTWFSIRQL